MKSGKFLIATPSIIGDTNFHRAVILLVDHKNDGTVGFILNKQLEYTLNDVMDGINFEIPLGFAMRDFFCLLFSILGVQYQP